SSARLGWSVRRLWGSRSCRLSFFFLQGDHFAFDYLVGDNFADDLRGFDREIQRVAILVYRAGVGEDHVQGPVSEDITGKCQFLTGLFEGLDVANGVARASRECLQSGRDVVLGDLDLL